MRSRKRSSKESKTIRSLKRKLRNCSAKLKKLLKKGSCRKTRSRSFGTTRINFEPDYYTGVTDYGGGILLANNAFSWMSSPLDRALNAGGA